MSFVPSPMQEQVIRHRGGSLLVAAAAGSGKTTTLIAHVLDRLKKKEGDLRRMIIVTYTNAAAAEMRTKLIGELKKALEADPDSPNLREQSAIAPQTHICTVDSLCGFLVRNYFDRLDISPDIRIADKAELVLLKDDVLDSLLEKKYTAADEEDLLTLLSDYSSEKGDRNIRDMVKKLTTPRRTPFIRMSGWRKRKNRSRKRKTPSGARNGSQAAGSSCGRNSRPCGTASSACSGKR